MNLSAFRLIKRARSAHLAVAVIATGWALALPALAKPPQPAPAASVLCAGFAAVPIRSKPAGTCVAQVAGAAQGLRLPRRILEVAPNRFWIVDMGQWEPGHGRVLELLLEPPAAGQAATPPHLRTLIDKLDRPLALVKGPDQAIYISEASRISRTALPPQPGTPLVLETVFDHLPTSGTHPLKEVVFGSDGSLYFHIGSATDACKQADGRQPMPCPELAGAQPRAAVYRAVYDPASKRFAAYTLFATGLRNSMALTVWTRPGAPDVLLQGENNIDYPDAALPPEEFNILRAGGFYGWPYCAGRQAARGYEKRYGCRKAQPPAALWPAHAAPLHMLAAPANSAWSGHVLVAWHGYRATGRRVMALRLNAQGQPQGQPQPVLDGWPQGAPTGLAFDHTGRLWVVEDRNRSVLLVTPKQ